MVHMANKQKKFTIQWSWKGVGRPAGESPTLPYSKAGQINRASVNYRAFINKACNLYQLRLIRPTI